MLKIPERFMEEFNKMNNLLANVSKLRGKYVPGYVLRVVLSWKVKILQLKDYVWGNSRLAISHLE